MSDLDINCLTMETINQKIAYRCLDNLILNANNTIRKNKKRPEASSMYEFIYKELKNPDITIDILEKRLSSLTNNNKIENKSTNGKSSYFVKAAVLPSATDESLPLLVNCETTSVKNKEKLVPDKINIIPEDKIISLEEKISVLNTKITALSSFIIEQLLVIKTMAKEKSTDLSVCDPNKFSDEIKRLREENNSKNCIIQTLLENQKNIQNTPHSRTLDINRNELKNTNPFILRKKSLSNIKSPSSTLITTSNTFDLLSENTENSLDAILTMSVPYQ